MDMEAGNRMRYAQSMEYSIGEFSMVSRLTVKALRFYQEQGILVPARVDGMTGYRYYHDTQLQHAQIIKLLREWDFSIEEIQEVMHEAGSDEDLRPFLERKLEQTDGMIRNLHEKAAHIRDALNSLTEGTMHSDTTIHIKKLAPQKIAGKRVIGKYSDYGLFIGEVYRKYGRWMQDKPMSLYYDEEYKEQDADFEAALPVRPQAEGPEVRELPACTVVSLIHEGPYDTLSDSYRVLTDYAKAKALKVLPPTREVYLKGPGMFFKGNQNRYLTEIQFPVDPASAAKLEADQ